MSAKKQPTLREQLAAAQRQAHAEHELLAEKVHIITDLAQTNVRLDQQLAATEKELDGAYRQAAGVNGTIDFLWEEIDRYRNRLMEHIHWDAMLPDDLREAVRKVRVAVYEWEHEEDP